MRHRQSWKFNNLCLSDRKKSTNGHLLCHHLNINNKLIIIIIITTLIEEWLWARQYLCIVVFNPRGWAVLTSFTAD